MANLLLTVMVPAFNEESNIQAVYEALCSEAATGHGMDWEFLFIDDGSTDNTFELLDELSRRDPRVKAIRFSRNFGSHVGVSAAMDFASGDAAVIVPCDLQDHPREIVRFLEKWREGYHVVWGVRSARGDKLTDVLFSNLFATIIRRIAIPNYPPTGTGGFCLLDRKVIEVLRRCPERNRMLAGLIMTSGFRQTEISFERGERTNGASRYTLAKKINLFIDCVVGFSSMPLRMASVCGLSTAAIGFLYAAYAGVARILYGTPVPGYTSIITIMLLLGGMVLTMLGVIGEYVLRILDEVRSRPLYIVWETRGFDTNVVSKYNTRIVSGKEV